MTHTNYMPLTSLFGFLVIFMLAISACSDAPQKVDIEYESITDPRDNQNYRILTIGKLQWMVDNLHILSDSTVGWCYEDKVNCKATGRLYSWESAQKACSGLGSGWRLATDEEWQQLANEFGGFNNGSKREGNPRQAYEQLFSGGLSGFEATTGGYRKPDGFYYAGKTSGFYWTGTEWNSGYAWRFEFTTLSGGQLSRYYQDKEVGYSCRCVRDLNE